jgi:hypothetical protein
MLAGLAKYARGQERQPIPRRSQTGRRLLGRLIESSFGPNINAVSCGCAVATEFGLSGDAN